MPTTRATELAQMGSLVTANPSTSTVTVGGTLSATTLNPNNTGFRNRIINGDMRIDQRNAGASVTPVPLEYQIDRWRYLASQSSKITMGQNQGAVTPPAGFSNYLGITSSSAYSVLSSDFLGYQQFVEGFNAADLAWGTANAQTVTLSFWVRSSLTGTFGGSIQNSGTVRSYPFSYTIGAANTWEQKSVIIAGDTSGTWLTTNGRGIAVNLMVGVGSTLSGTAGAWATADYRSATGATSVVGTSGATFYITGVQLEAGSTATDFERRPIGTELALCQRYYEVGNAWLQVTGTASSAGMSQQYSVTKRALATNAFTNITYNNGSSLTDYSSSLPSPLGTTALSFYFVPNAAGAFAIFNWSASAEL